MTFCWVCCSVCVVFIFSGNVVKGIVFRMKQSKNVEKHLLILIVSDVYFLSFMFVYLLTFFTFLFSCFFINC